MLYVRKPRAVDAVEQQRQELVDEKHAFRMKFGYALGRLALEVGPSRAARQLGVSRQVSEYWRDKVLDPSFHPLPHGGRRDEAMAFGGIDGDVAAQIMVYAALEANPTISFAELLEKVQQVPGLEHMTSSWLSRTTSGWRYTWKRAIGFARQKYTCANMQYYLQYCTRVVDYRLDEVCIYQRIILSHWAVSPCNGADGFH
jgi:hypothetical protein